MSLWIGEYVSVCAQKSAITKNMKGRINQKSHTDQCLGSDVHKLT